MVASPGLCLAVRDGGSGFLAKFDLSDKERKRLLEVVWQKGMSVSCSMYRSNRITPLYTLLNFTCLLLGENLRKELDEYWSRTVLPDLQFRQEIERFGSYLEDRLASGAITNPFIQEVLSFELAMNELQFLPRRSIIRQIHEAAPLNEGGSLQVHPLIRVVQFTHEPCGLLDHLRREMPVPDELAAGEYFVLLSAIKEEMDIKPIDAKRGSILRRIQKEGTVRNSDEFRELCLEGLLVPSSSPWQTCINLQT